MDVVSIRHKGLRRFFESDQTRGLPQDRVEKLRRILSAIDEADTLHEIEAMPGWRLHPLRGAREGDWSISFTGNWRMTFRIENGQIHGLNLEDYHR